MELNGEDSSADIVSPFRGQGRVPPVLCVHHCGQRSLQRPSECDAIIDGTAVVDAAPKLWAHNADAALIHEAAIGKIAGEQILKLRTLGLTEEEAEKKIIEGFLS